VCDQFNAHAAFLLAKETTVPFGQKTDSAPEPDWALLKKKSVTDKSRTPILEVFKLVV
jgi:hypothetical protein